MTKVPDTSMFERAKSIYPFLYGADDVSSLLKKMADPDRKIALRALRDFEANFFHQGVHYLQATPLFVPFLFELLTCDVAIAPELIVFIGEMYFTSYRNEDNDLPLVIDPHEPTPEERATLLGIEAEAEALFPLLDSPSPEVRAATLWVLTGMGKEPERLRARLEIEDDPRVRFSLHVALTGAFHLPPAPEPVGTLASDVLRVLTMTYPLDEETAGALRRVLLAPWMPTLHFVTGLPAQIAALQIYRLGRQEAKLASILRAVHQEQTSGSKKQEAPPHGGSSEPWHLDSRLVVRDLLRWVVMGDDPPRRPRDLSPEQRWVMEHIGGGSVRGVNTGQPEAHA